MELFCFNFNPHEFWTFFQFLKQITLSFVIMLEIQLFRQNYLKMALHNLDTEIIDTL